MYLFIARTNLHVWHCLSHMQCVRLVQIIVKYRFSVWGAVQTVDRRIVCKMNHFGRTWYVRVWERDLE